MNKLLIIFLVFNFINADEISQSLVKNNDENSFITEYEYGKMLWKNPRGVSCVKCHAKDAKGKFISKFTHVTRKNTYNCFVKSNDITDISREDFIRKLDPSVKKKRIKFEKHQVCEKLIYGNTMPKYFLTKNEMNSIYYYITHIKDNDE
ncbi:MAG TPA: hypothetical protein EYG97_01170 [Arcobacter sp.]|nr:hypothetical protein [Arcobacter sp.]HIP55615.1 hypothetical protein [Arcobacter sp.]